MRRIAFFGPVNPTPSGISDYDEELLPLLRKEFDIDVFVDGPARDADQIFQHRAFVTRHHHNPYDLIIYQLGNSLLHEYMYAYLFQYPGAVVFHDYGLHHSRAKMLMLKGFFEEYMDEALSAHPEEPRLGKSLYGGMAGDLLQYYFPFVRLVLSASLAAGAHTDFVAEKLRITETPVVKIPMAVQTNFAKPQEDPYPGKLIVASFGMATKEKRISTVLKALAELRYYYPSLLYLIVGEVAEWYDLAGEIREHGLQNIVQVTGRVDRERFDALLGRADIVVNLRYPTAGEMSATLLRAMAHGKPVLMSRLPHLLEIPAEAAFRIRPDRELDDLFHYLWQLIESDSLRRRVGSAAQKYIRENHRPDQMLDEYYEMIDQAILRKDDFQQPDLPVHLRTAPEILHNYIRKTCFQGSESDLIRWILPPQSGGSST